MSSDLLNSGQPGPAGDLVKDTTTAGFRQDVLAESMKQPVLVDFWAPWCGPCKQLGPTIEKAVRAAKGRVKLVKMNIDEHPQIAGQLGVQSIPAVFAFDRGQPVDGFVGALPESQIKGFIERLVGPVGADAAALLAEAKAQLDLGDAVGAAERYAAVLAEDPENPDALGGIVRAQVLAGNLVQARRILESAPPAKADHAAITGARAALELAEQAEAFGDIGTLLRKVEAQPADHQARFDLALALNARGKRLEAVEHLIAILRKDRGWNDEAARRQLIQFFDAWGPTDEATLIGRRQLSATLFA
ncbi:thioredoxin [Rhabdaerophilum calidifontis]|uniref:thioredoxin n=1 Tax=Rhabdaerophilum calidifontis TaxID=2604328 RepID=UPI001238BEC5|nr:thioredoxin [Rhabdaerophilum calidifontis]